MLLTMKKTLFTTLAALAAPFAAFAAAAKDDDKYGLNATAGAAQLGTTNTLPTTTRPKCIPRSSAKPFIPTTAKTTP